MNSVAAVVGSWVCVALIGGADLLVTGAPELTDPGVSGGCEVVGRIRICSLVAGPFPWDQGVAAAFASGIPRAEQLAAARPACSMHQEVSR